MRINSELSATAGDVRDVTTAGLTLAAVGAAARIAIAVPASTLVASWLYGVAEHDLTTYAGAAVFLLLVAAVASRLPALKILRLDPARILR